MAMDRRTRRSMPASQTHWMVESRSSQSCTVDIVVPDLGIQKYLEPGDGNAIDPPALKAGRLDYTCSVGMCWGSITVQDRPAS